MTWGSPWSEPVLPGRPLDLPPGVRVIAPAHFVEEVTSESILAGTAMGRRATYQFGFADVNSLVKFRDKNPDRAVKGVLMVYDAPPFAIASLAALGALVSVNPDGSYTFTPGTDFDALADGASRDVSFTYTATDDQGGVSAPKTVTITVTGTNDVPVISSAAQGGTVAEDGVLTTSGQVVAGDLDRDAVLTYSANSSTGAYGSLALDAGSGAWTYSLGNHQSLSANDTLAESFVVTVSDDQGATAFRQRRRRHQARPHRQAGETDEAAVHVDRLLLEPVGCDRSDLAQHVLTRVVDAGARAHD